MSDLTIGLPTYFSLAIYSISGLTKFKPGYWVGVKYDEPVGKNDGRLVFLHSSS